VLDQRQVADRLVLRETGRPETPREPGSGSNSSTSTGAPVSAANDAAPTNRWLDGVWITRTA